MQIDSFHIQGFKSLADVQVQGLSDINIFYGLNDTGKSNIFQALFLWHHICLEDSQQKGDREELAQIRQNEIIPKLIEPFAPPIHTLNRDKSPILQVQLLLDTVDADARDGIAKLIMPDTSSHTNRMAQKICLEAQIDLGDGTMTHLAHTDTIFNQEINRNRILYFLSHIPHFHLIQADRRFQPEQQGQQNDGSITHQNLKQALFYAYLSRDMHQKQRLNAIKTTLADSPFELGELDIALDPNTNQIDIGFIRPIGRIPLENVGSGIQQLLLVLGQIFLNNYPIIAIEEPEMNLSPQYQQYLLVALKKIMADPAVSLRQLFISTHSPYFEFAENFYDVTKDEQKMTQVTQRPLNERVRYFPNTQVSDSNSGARLNSFNQITLDDQLLGDMNLQRGDMVYTIKNEAKRWELWHEQEILADLQAVFDE